MTAHRKIKSVAKIMIPSGPELDKAILETMKKISALVGSTLGPGGKVVAIERQEFGIPDLVTKDGVTVFRALGFNNPVQHSIMTLARDASVRTATEAGDGTTTATVLAEAFTRFTHKFCQENPKASPQRVVRTIEKVFRTKIEKIVKSAALKADPEMLRKVALTSTNGDVELTESVAKCFELTGDAGNVTLTEASGPSGYSVEVLKGYPVTIGYEDCVGRYFSIFMNDRANNRVYMEKPLFVLYHGTVMEFATLVPLLQKLGERWGGPDVNKGSRNIVVCAVGFSQQCLDDMAGNWSGFNTLNVYPLVVPKNAMQTGQLDFLQDLAAVTGSAILDPVTNPAQQAPIESVGPELEYFEATRYRSNIVGQADEGLVLARVEELEAELPKCESIVEKNIVNERRAKLTGGIARLTISAPTSGELREKKDRAEDAICAWRGASKHGALPGGGWMLIQLSQMLWDMYSLDQKIFENSVVCSVICYALVEPVRKLLSNCGYSEEEIDEKLKEMDAHRKTAPVKIFDALEGQFKPVAESGVIDSLPAVLEALRNSISIASQLGTLGGVVVFPRDPQLERDEASSTYDFMRNSGMGNDEG